MKTIKNHIFIIFVLLVLLLQISPAFADGDRSSRQVISLEYFYMNPCAACDEESKLREKLNELVGSDNLDFIIRLNSYNTFKESNSKLFDEYCKEKGIGVKNTQLPVIFINNQVLVGQKQIDEKLGEAIAKAKKTVTSEILYFHVTSCGECDKASKQLEALEDTYAVNSAGNMLTAAISIKRLNVEEGKNLELVRLLFKEYNVPEKQQEVPIVFFSKGYLSGEEAISKSLVSEIKKGNTLGTVVTDADENVDASVKSAIKGHQALGVFFTGLLNGFNPCSISLLLFFISLILVKQANIIKLGIAFILGKFIAYTLLGTVLYSLLLKTGGLFHTYMGVLKYILAGLSLVLVFINLWDYFAARNEKYGKIRLQLPPIIRDANHKLIRKLTASGSARLLLPVSFLLGLVISAGEFLCTGQIYLATIIYVLKNSPVLDLNAVVYFLLYGLAMILPLLVLTLLIQKGREMFDVSELVRTRMPLIKMANALFFLAFAAFIILLF